MGNIKVRVRDPESVNFDKICRLALAIIRDGNSTFDAIEIVNDDSGLDIEGADVDREYWKVEGRSMTELYAIRAHLGTADASGVVCVASPFTGVVELCQALAENHGKVDGKNGGSLYKKGMIASYAKGLTLLPDRASEIVTKLVKAVLASLKDAKPATSLKSAAGPEWDEIDDALASAERAVYGKARDIARLLQAGQYPDGHTFPLAKATGQYAPQGIAIVTRNPNLMKHLWAAMKAAGPSFMVAVAVVSHPDTKRVAVLCSTQYPIDIRHVAKALRTRFPAMDIDINLERSSIVWDPRSKTDGPTAADVQEAVSEHLAFFREEREARPTGVGATIGDALRLQARKRR